MYEASTIERCSWRSLLCFLSPFLPLSHHVRMRSTWKPWTRSVRMTQVEPGGDDIFVDFLVEDLAVEGSQWKVDKRAALRWWQISPQTARCHHTPKNQPRHPRGQWSGLATPRTANQPQDDAQNRLVHARAAHSDRKTKWCPLNDVKMFHF